MQSHPLRGHLSRRTFLRVGAGMFGGALLAACAPAAAPAPATESGQTTPAGEVVEISFMGWGGAEEDEGVRAAIGVFQEEQPNIRVTWLHTPENYAERFLANIAAGTPPDTAFIGSGDFRTYVRDNVLMDITDFLEADTLVGSDGYFIEPQETERCTQDGRWYGIGSCWVAPHIYYNADAFAEAGVEPPSNDPDQAWSWDHFVEVARQMTIDVNGNHPGDAGFDADNIQRWGVHWPTTAIALHSAIAANGGNWIDPETSLLLLDQPEAIEALQRIADLVLVHQVMPQAAAMEGLGMSNAQMLENDRLAMAIDGSWALAWIHQIEPTLGTGVLPAQDVSTATSMQAHLHSALAATSHPNEAWEWVRFLSTPFYQTQFCQMGLWLPSQAALMTEEGLQTWITDGVHPPNYELVATEYLPRFGHVLYQPVGWPRANAIITPALDRIWIGDATAEQAMAEAVPETNEALEQEQARGG